MWIAEIDVYVLVARWPTRHLLQLLDCPVVSAREVVYCCDDVPFFQQAHGRMGSNEASTSRDLLLRMHRENKQTEKTRGGTRLIKLRSTLKPLHSL